MQNLKKNMSNCCIFYQIWPSFVFFLGHSTDLIKPICDQPGSLQTTGVTLTAMQRSGCSAVDVVVMLSMQLWNNPPRYVKGNEQLPLPATASVQRYIAELQILLTDIIYVSFPGWLRSTVGGTPVFGRRTDPVLRSTFSWRVTTIWVTVRCRSANQVNSDFHPFGVDKWVVSCS